MLKMGYIRELEKIEVDYVRMLWKHSDVKRIEITQYSLAVYLILEITFYNPYIDNDGKNDTGWEKELKKLKRRIRKYDLKESAFYMDKDMEDVLGKVGMAYASRKKELFDYRHKICNWLKPERGTGRNRMLLVLGEEMLSFLELKMLLLTIKDVFEDITIFSRETKAVNNVCTYLQDEWGVWITKTDKIRDLRDTYDATFLLVPFWKEDYGKMCFEKVYLLSREEREPAEYVSGLWKGVNFFSGMEYICDREPIPHQMAVDIRYQKEENCIKSKPVSVGIRKWK